VKPNRVLAGTVLLVALAAGCGGGGGGTGSSGTPAQNPTPPNTGLPIARKAQDVVNQTNARTGQLEQQTGSDRPAG
jgi:hypothetical protein